MATRIQIRRGTTSEWNSADPTLNQGEFGYNVTLGKFKIGDGSSVWSVLEYTPTSEDLSSSLGDYIELSEKGSADGIAELDASKNILAAAGIIFEGTDDEFETTLNVIDPTADRTISLPNASGTIALTTDLDAYVLESLFDAKGDLLVASADNTPAKLTVGTNGYILTANSGATNGVEWAAAPISLPSQTGNEGKYLTTDGTTASWGIVSSYAAPIIGSTSIASGATVTTIAGLTLTSPTLSSAVATTSITLNATAELRLADSDSSHYVGFKSPATVTTNKIWTLPAADGTSGQVLTTNGSGTFSFSTPAAGAAFSELLLIGA